VCQCKLSYSIARRKGKCGVRASEGELGVKEVCGAVSWCMGVCVGLCARPGNYSNSCCADLTQRDERASHNMAGGIGRTDQDVSSDGTVSTDHGVLLSGLAACRRHSSHPPARIELHKNKSNMQNITLHYSEREGQTTKINIKMGTK